MKLVDGSKRLFIPFLIVDMVVANVLLALGMHMLSPTSVSLPFKLLLFVLVEGWYLLARACCSATPSRAPRSGDSDAGPD